MDKYFQGGAKICQLSPVTLQVLNSRLPFLFLYHLERLRNEYLKSEMVFDYYIDLLNTRGMAGIGGSSRIRLSFRVNS